jgi:hypothetical protein
MVIKPNSEVTADKFNIADICTNGNHAQKLITKLYNYQITVLTRLIQSDTSEKSKLSLQSSQNFLFQIWPII